MPLLAPYIHDRCRRRLAAGAERLRDVEQEVWLRLCQHLPESALTSDQALLRHVAGLCRWVRAADRETQIRQERAEFVLAMDDVEPLAFARADSCEETIAARDLVERLTRSLPRDERPLLALLAEGVRPADAAAELAWSSQAMAAWLHRTRALLRERLL